jgi:formylglycine-generating enzyme required for sulfatase activity
VHDVRITYDFYISETEITAKQYAKFHDDYQGLGPSIPYATGMSWEDAAAFCRWLSRAEKKSYRLPTEAEWEYACRAGTTTPFYYGANLTSGMANFDGQYGYYSGQTLPTNNPTGTFLNRPVAVGGYQSNARGLYDMGGNIWEWCQDWYGTFTSTGVIDPQGPATGTQRVFRGGTFNSTGAGCRSANRDKTNPALGANTIGFRVVLAPGP